MGIFDLTFQDIFRKYPNKYESIISTLCENLDTLDEPEARYEEIMMVKYPYLICQEIYFACRASKQASQSI